MEADLSVQHGTAKNPIPSPTVVVRSEFPTLNRSRQQQSLTCLVTVEVPEGLWRPDPEDLRGSPQAQPLSRDDGFQRPRSESPKKPSSPDQSSETLDTITEDLRVRVENWHGLDFQRYFQMSYLVRTVTDGLQIWKTSAVWDCQSGQRSSIMARVRMLPFLGDAHLREREEDNSTAKLG
jgi:hypothetical protein